MMLSKTNLTKAKLVDDFYGEVAPWCRNASGSSTSTQDYTTKSLDSGPFECFAWEPGESLGSVVGSTQNYQGSSTDEVLGQFPQHRADLTQIEDQNQQGVREQDPAPSVTLTHRLRAQYLKNTKRLQELELERQILESQQVQLMHRLQTEGVHDFGAFQHEMGPEKGLCAWPQQVDPAAAPASSPKQPHKVSNARLGISPSTSNGSAGGVSSAKSTPMSPMSVTCTTPNTFNPRLPRRDTPTLRGCLQELQEKEDPSHVLVLRKTNRLGWRAKELLVQFFSQFEGVKNILVPSINHRRRNRLSSMAFVVMESKETADALYNGGAQYRVYGFPIIVSRFVQLHRACDIDAYEAEDAEAHEPEEATPHEDLMVFSL